MTRCPSDLELEAFLLDPPRSGIAAHVAACARCRQQLAVMRAVGDAFARDVFPATVDAVVARSRPRRPARWVLAAAPLSIAAAAAVLFFVARPAPDYVGTKGGALALSVFVAGPAGARAVKDGEAVPAQAAIRFQVRPAHACGLWIVSVDGAGQVSRLYPAAGEAAAGVESAATLPGGAVLDGRPGPERIFAVCSPSPLAYPAVERAAHEAAAGGDAGVRAAPGLAGLPRDAAQATLLLEKRP